VQLALQGALGLSNSSTTGTGKSRIRGQGSTCAVQYVMHRSERQGLRFLPSSHCLYDPNNDANKGLRGVEEEEGCKAVRRMTPPLRHAPPRRHATGSPWPSLRGMVWDRCFGTVQRAHRSCLIEPKSSLIPISSILILLYHPVHCQSRPIHDVQVHQSRRTSPRPTHAPTTVTAFASREPHFLHHEPRRHLPGAQQRRTSIHFSHSPVLPFW
jgi:hypothetical protein